MRTLAKVLVGFLLLVVVLVIAASVALKLYFTPERIKALVIPPAERALERKVSFESASVSLFSGVVVKGFVVKEKDGKADFVRVKRFVLRYKLFPLLKKRVVITRISFVEPYVHLWRDKSGHFNYESLGVFKKKKAASGKKAPAYAFALTIDSIDVKNAKVLFEDALGRLPNLDARARAHVSLSLSPSGISFSGSAALKAGGSFKGHRFTVEGSYFFDASRLKYETTVRSGKQEITLRGAVSDYMRRPSVVLDVYSPFLQVDRLMNLKKEFASEGAQGGKAKGKKAPGVPLPEVKGKVEVDRLLYRGLEVKNFRARYSLSKGVFKLEEAAAGVAGGSVSALGQVGIVAKPSPYSGNATVSSISLDALLRGLYGKSPVSGNLTASVVFSGSGFEPQQLKSTLSAEGRFEVASLSVKDSAVFRALSQVLMLKELKAPSFDRVGGNFRVKDGRLLVKSAFTGKSVSMVAEGSIGLDGTLDIPLVVKLSPELSAKLVKRVPYARYFPRENGWIVLPVKLEGTVKRPLPIPEVKKAARRGLKKRLKGRMKEEMGKGLRRFFK